MPGSSPGGLDVESAVRMAVDAVLLLTALLGSLCPQSHSKEAAHRTSRTAAYPNGAENAGLSAGRF